MNFVEIMFSGALQLSLYDDSCAKLFFKQLYSFATIKLSIPLSDIVSFKKSENCVLPKL